MYDKNNPFAKILRNELPKKIVYEDQHSMAFWTIDPVAPVHILIIPKREYCNYDEFISKASDAEIVSLTKAIEKVAEIMKLDNGYRIIINNGNDSGQTVFHLHIHLIGGKELEFKI